jgi:hypothetical protein
VATLGEVTAVIDDRCRALLAEARAATGDPTKPSVAQCIAWATRMLGYPTASLLGADNDEVGAVDSMKVDALLDLAELRTLESILTNLTGVDLTTGPVSEDISDLPDRIQKLIPEKRKAIGLMWGRYLVQPFDPTTDRRKARMRTI